MAGRPMSMIRRVEALEVAGLQLARRMAAAVPEVYLDNDRLPAREDELTLAWRECYRTAFRLWRTLTRLGDAVRRRAGVHRDGPTAGCTPWDDPGSDPPRQEPPAAEDEPEVLSSAPPEDSSTPAAERAHAHAREGCPAACAANPGGCHAPAEEGRACVPCREGCGPGGLAEAREGLSSCQADASIIEALLDRGYKLTVQTHFARGRAPRATAVARHSDGQTLRGWGADPRAALADLAARNGLLAAGSAGA